MEANGEGIIGWVLGVLIASEGVGIEPLQQEVGVIAKVAIIVKGVSGSRYHLVAFIAEGIERGRNISHLLSISEVDGRNERKDDGLVIVFFYNVCLVTQLVHVRFLFLKKRKKNPA